MMSFKQILIALALTCAIPSSYVLAAATPSNIQNVRASIVDDGAIVVTWDALKENDVAFYHVYYSRKSILQNNGDYDDDVRTKGTETTYTFTSIPVQGEKLFFTVLAESQGGVTSEGFEVEASVDLASVANVEKKDTSPMPTGEAPTTTAVPMAIAGVTPLSSTGIGITFTKPLKRGAEFGSGFFLLTETGGTLAKIHRVEIEGSDMLIHTEPLNVGKIYILRFIKDIPADDGTFLTTATPPAQFTAVADPVLSEVRSTSSSSISSSLVSSVASISTSSSSSNSSVASSMSSSETAQKEEYDRTTSRAFLGGSTHQEELKNVTVTYQKQPNGQYTVLAAWTPLKDATGYDIETSINGGAYRHATTVNARTTSLAFKRIKQGTTIAVRVTATRSNGETVVASMERETRLPNSGLSMLSVTCIAGALAGVRLTTRRKEQVLA